MGTSCDAYRYRSNSHGGGVEIECDVVVVGAGPAGSMAALRAAESGADTVLIEKRRTVGTPLRCAEGISQRRLLEVGIEPDPRWISSEIVGTVMVSPSGRRLRVDEKHESGIVGYVLERHLFDKALAEKAAVVGAKLMVGISCTGVLKKGDRIVGIETSGPDGPGKIMAKCVIAADGFESQVLRWAGMDSSLELGDIISCVQYRMGGVSAEDGFCHFYLGSVSPGGYAWIFPKGKGVANVGLGVQGKLCNGKPPKEYLDDFVATCPELKGAYAVEMVSGAVSVTPGMENTVSDGILVAGDAARVIDPMTGGGLYHALLTGSLAGETAARCVATGDVSSQALSSYDRAWREKIGEELSENWRRKEGFVGLKDESLDGLIVAATEAGLGRVRIEDLANVARERYPEIIQAMKNVRGE